MDTLKNKESMLVSIRCNGEVEESQLYVTMVSTTLHHHDESYCQFIINSIIDYEQPESKDTGIEKNAHVEQSDIEFDKEEEESDVDGKPKDKGPWNGEDLYTKNQELQKIVSEQKKALRTSSYHQI